MYSKAVCEGVRTDVSGVKSFYFIGGDELRFEAGQFITLKIPGEDGELLRSYTVASSPLNRGAFNITVREVPNGQGSGWLHKYLKKGDIVEFSGPHGLFTPARYETEKMLFLAAGSGITPFLSVLRSWRDRSVPVDAHLIYSVRDTGQIIEHQELIALAKNITGFKLTILPEQVDDDSWHSIQGRLDSLWLSALARDIHERRVFTCGPAPYMRAIKEYLQDTGVGLDRYHEEAFASGEPISFKELSSDHLASQFTVSFVNSEVEVQCGPDQTLLEAAESAGVQVGAACRMGICGACQTQKLEGSVEMQELGGILPAEKAAGKILLCCSRPSSDLVLEI